MESGHPSSGRATARRKDVSNADILNKCRVEVDLGIYCTKDAREDLLWTGVLETTTLALYIGCQQGNQEEKALEGTLVIAERTAATMTTSLSVFARTAALPEGKVWALWVMAGMCSVVRDQRSR
jgi:hypothetical protein